MKTMEADRKAAPPSGGLTGNLLREVMRTAPLKEIMLLHLTGIDPDNASRLVEGLLWEDPAVSLSLISAAPEIANWTLELLLELGKQLAELPPSLLKEMLGTAGGRLDPERLKELRAVYARLVTGVVREYVSPGAREPVAEAAGRALDGMIRSYNEARRRRRAPVRERVLALFSQLDRREALSAAGGLLKGAASAILALLGWLVRGAGERA